MSEVQTSTLRLIGGKTSKDKSTRLIITFKTKKGATQEWMPKRESFSPELAAMSLEELNGMEVDFELIGGHPSRIRRKGEPWQEPERKAPSVQTQVGQQRTPFKKRSASRYKQIGGSKPMNQSQHSAVPEQAGYPRKFYNPYNFVPAPQQRPLNGELNDHEPLGHQSYHPDHWSGHITVKLTTVTPMLLVDAARATSDDNGHKTFPARVDSAGSPYLPPTSLKGMLRAEYEAITNSRFGVFRGHEDRLAFRTPAKGGAQVVPARITDDGHYIELLPGFSEIGPQGEPISDKPPVMYAAWLPIYHNRRSQLPSPVLRNPNNLSLKSGRCVWAEVELWEHHVSHKGKTFWDHNFNYWRILEIRPGGGQRPTSYSQPTPSKEAEREPPDRNKSQSFHTPKQGYQHNWVNGYLLINNKNIDGKHDERVFFVTQNHSQAGKLKAPVRDDLKKKWTNLIKNYQECHSKEIKQGLRKPPALRDPECIWSRHITAGVSVRELSPGTLCYASVRRDNSGSFKVLDLYPVMISRDLYATPPEKMLHSSLVPAKELKQLSPADRVFGWVNHDGKGAWKGQLRIDPSTCYQGKEAVEHFGKPGVPLAILAEPKPAQARFYTSEDRVECKPLTDGKNKLYGYLPERGLRGRKVYPHHAYATQLQGYWEKPQENCTKFRYTLPDSDSKFYREYCRPNVKDRKTGKDKTRDNQNRSLLAWVKPNMTFTFDVHLTNLSAVEIGALLWLLDPMNVPCHRLGGGKPLGFGSVKLEIEGVDLRDGEAWKDFYSKLIGELEQGNWIRKPDDYKLQELITLYQEAVLKAYPAANFGEVSFIRAFQVAACGFADLLPIHYPRLTPHREDSEEKNYEWFVTNEKEGREPGLRLSLPTLTDPQPGLPLRPQKKQNS